MRRTLGTIAIACALLLVAVQGAQAAIVAQSTRSLDATEGVAIPSDRILVFEDAGDCAPGLYSITIRWGDGSQSAGQISFAVEDISGGGVVRGCSYGAFGDHTYARPGTYAIGATICRGAECVDTDGGVAAVSSVDVTGAADDLTAVAGQLLAAEVAEFRHDNRSRQPSQYTAVVDWGDGTTGPGVVGGDDGRFEVSGQHVYAAPGTYVLRATLLEGGAPVSVSSAGTVTVAPAPGGAPAPAAGAPVAVQQTAASLAGAVRSTMRLGFRAVSRRALRRGLPIRVSLPSTIRSLRIAILRVGARSTRLGATTVRVRGGSVLRGVRTVSLRVPLSAALRRSMRPGAYALRFSVDAGLATTARFTVRR